MSNDADKPDEPDRTVFISPKAGDPTSPPQAAPPAPAPPPPSSAAEDATLFAPAPKAAATGVGPGAVLNSIYEVKRFIARGGMGEVWEGVSLSTDERVAIKVILPALAADPNVQAMFKREANTLSNLHHPAVVNYRLAANDPQLNVFYIVTQFIDGAPMSDMLGELNPTTEELRKLIRRLAEGLGAAHAQGVIHRDMSPDNVLLPGRRLDQAKIIDFGIAKDTDASKGTIVGDGFAGKLGYVAPEQFGDFDRAVGPWTDVYSLGLVILALILKKNVDMGATLVEAVDKRRAGLDLSVAPAELRPLLSAMLTADPAKRIRSMEDVVSAIDDIGIAQRTGGQPAKAKAARAPKPSAPAAATDRATSAARPNRLPLIIGGAAAVLVLIVGLVWGLTQASKPKEGPTTVAAQVDARQTVEAALPSVSCSWLDLTDVTSTQQGLTVRLRGVAGRPGAVQGVIAGAATRAGLTLGNLDLDEVAPVGDNLCTVLDTVRAVRLPGGGALTTPQRRFEIVPQPDGRVLAKPVINMAPRNPATDFALVGLEPNGAMTLLIRDRTQLQEAIAAGAVTDMGNDAYRLTLNADHSGWSGMLLLLGRAPFDEKLLGGGVPHPEADWPERFKSAAAQGGWKTEMVWFRTAKPGEN